MIRTSKQYFSNVSQQWLTLTTTSQQQLSVAVLSSALINDSATTQTESRRTQSVSVSKEDLFFIDKKNIATASWSI